MRMLLLVASIVTLAFLTSDAFLAVEANTVTVPINAAISILWKAAIDRIAITYKLYDPTFPSVTSTLITGQAATLASVSAGIYDFIATPGQLPAANQNLNRDMKSYPLIITSMAPFYNLPTATVGSAPLILDVLSMCQIWRANITHWDDPRLVRLNPALTLPHKQIIRMAFGFPNDGNNAASMLCTKVDPVWAATIGQSPLPNIPGTYVSIPVTASTNGLASAIVDTPYSFGLNGMNALLVVTSAQVAWMVNAAGKVVQPTPTTMSQNFIEMAPNGVPKGATAFDLTNPQNANAWPLCLSAWLLIDTAKAQTTCASKKQVLNFLLYLYTSPVAAAIAESQQLATIPNLYLQQSGLLTQLKTDLKCDGQTLVPLDSSSAFIQGNALLSSSVSFLAQLYRQLDATFTYSFTTTNDALALNRVAAGEIDFAVVSTNALTNDQIDSFMAPQVNDGAVVSGGLLYPSFLNGVALVYVLPTAITAVPWSTGNTFGLPALYPLKLDVDTAAAIFTSQITSWTDPRMLLLNPQLDAWFAYTGAPTALVSVTCCTAGSDPMVASTILQQTLFKSSATHFMQSYATPTAAFQAVLSANMSLLESEGRMQTKTLITPGSVSYKLINTASTILTSEFQIVQTNDRGVTETLAPTPAAMLACAADKVRTPELLASYVGNPKQRAWITNSPGCYPLTTITFTAVASSFTRATASSGSTAAAASCSRAQASLKMLAWMQSSSVVTQASTSIGLVALSPQLPTMSAYIVGTMLNTATCDGKTILITLPIIWRVASGVTSFAIAASAIAIFVCLITVLGIWSYRHHPVVRGSSPLFLVQVCLGLILLAIGCMAWAAPVNSVNCQVFQWFGNLGFTLAFGPLFVKTWRIYAIFSAKKIKVVKIPNSRLIWAVVGMLAFEIILGAIWSAVDPLRPIMYQEATKQADGAIRELTHCSVGSSGMAFVGVEAAFKGILLFFGSLMGFSTRKVVSTFNESSTIAWAIYNVVFSSLIVACIIVFIKTLGDTLILLMLFLLLWIIYCTWAFMFVSKASAILSKEDLVDHASKNTSLGSYSGSNGSFSFASIVHMQVTQLTGYARALEHQLARVRTRIMRLGGKVPTTGALQAMAGESPLLRGEGTAANGGDSPTMSRRELMLPAAAYIAGDDEVRVLREASPDRQAPAPSRSLLQKQHQNQPSSPTASPSGSVRSTINNAFFRASPPGGAGSVANNGAGTNGSPTGGPMRAGLGAHRFRSQATPSNSTATPNVRVFHSSMDATPIPPPSAATPTAAAVAAAASQLMNLPGESVPAPSSSAPVPAARHTRLPSNSAAKNPLASEAARLQLRVSTISDASADLAIQPSPSAAGEISSPSVSMVNGHGASLPPSPPSPLPSSPSMDAVAAADASLPPSERASEEALFPASAADVPDVLRVSQATKPSSRAAATSS